MSATITPIPPTGLTTPEAVKAAIAAVLLEECGITIDVNPTETEPLPMQANKAWAERKGSETAAAQAYWWLEWRGRVPGIRTFGTPEYTRQNVDTFDLSGVLPVREASANAPDWGAALTDAMNSLEANRRLSGRILTMDRPSLTENRIRTASVRTGRGSESVRYHYSVIRFMVRTQDRLLITQG